MATEKRTELMRHLGLRLVAPEDVELRQVQGGETVAVLKRFEGIRAVMMAYPENIELGFDGIELQSASLRNYYGDKTTAVHPDYPLRLEGFFADEAGSTYRFAIGHHGEQLRGRVSGLGAFVQRLDRIGDGTYDMVPLAGVRQIQYRDLEAGERRRLLLGFAEMLTYVRNRTTRDAAYSALDMFATRPREMIAWRDTEVPASKYLALRSELAVLGAMVSSRGATSNEFIEAAQSMRDRGLAIEVAISAWNGLHPRDSVHICSCGHLEREDDVTDGTHGQTICGTCIDEGHYVLVEDLGTYDHRSNAYEHDDGSYYSYPQRDEDEDDRSGVRRYSANVLDYLRADHDISPSPYGEVLMGIELEVVPEYDASEAIEHTLSNLAPGYAILKDDGSLSDGGFEIVTAPRGLPEHIKRFREWEPYPTLRAWDAQCCGLHVHLSSAGFTAATLGKFIEFINSTANDSFIRSIAGRHPARDQQAADYCQRDGCQPGNPKKTLSDKAADRYFMVNTTNVTYDEAKRLGLRSTHAIGRGQNTIELRVFRASLKKSRLLAQIEFAHAAVMFCRWSSMRELDKAHFLKWLKAMAGVYPNLAKWFGVRANTDVVDATPKARAGADV